MNSSNELQNVSQMEIPEEEEEENSDQDSEELEENTVIAKTNKKKRLGIILTIVFTVLFTCVVLVILAIVITIILLLLFFPIFPETENEDTVPLVIDFSKENGEIIKNLVVDIDENGKGKIEFLAFSNYSKNVTEEQKAKYKLQDFEYSWEIETGLQNVTVAEKGESIFQKMIIFSGINFVKVSLSGVHQRNKNIKVPKFSRYLRWIGYFLNEEVEWFESNEVIWCENGTIVISKNDYSDWGELKNGSKIISNICEDTYIVIRNETDSTVTTISFSYELSNINNFFKHLYFSVELSNSEDTNERRNNAFGDSLSWKHPTVPLTLSGDVTRRLDIIPNVVFDCEQLVVVYEYHEILWVDVPYYFEIVFTNAKMYFTVELELEVKNHLQITLDQSIEFNFPPIPTPILIPITPYIEIAGGATFDFKGDAFFSSILKSPTLSLKNFRSMAWYSDGNPVSSFSGEGDTHGSWTLQLGKTEVGCNTESSFSPFISFDFGIGIPIKKIGASVAFSAKFTQNNKLVSPGRCKKGEYQVLKNNELSLSIKLGLTHGISWTREIIGGSKPVFDWFSDKLRVVFKDECSCYVCDPECVNGECKEDECDCEDNWQGETCSEPYCDPECSVYGTCVGGTGVCDCEDNWQGETCSIPHCDPECSIHGTCVGGIGVCNCENMWKGVDCSIPDCEKHTTSCPFLDNCEVALKYLSGEIVTIDDPFINSEVYICYVEILGTVYWKQAVPYVTSIDFETECVTGDAVLNSVVGQVGEPCPTTNTQWSSCKGQTSWPPWTTGTKVICRDK